MVVLLYSFWWREVCNCCGDFCCGCWWCFELPMLIVLVCVISVVKPKVPGQKVWHLIETESKEAEEVLIMLVAAEGGVVSPEWNWRKGRFLGTDIVKRRFGKITWDFKVRSEEKRSVVDWADSSLLAVGEIAMILEKTEMLSSYVVR